MELAGVVGGDAEPDADDRERGDRHVDEQQHLPGRDREHEAAGGGADREPDEADGRDHRDRPHAEAVVLEQPEGQRHRAGRRHRGGDAHDGAHGDQLLGGGDERGGQAGRAEQRPAR